MLDEAGLARLGLASVGKGVLISERASFYGAARIHIGDHTRIDDFCVISAGAGGIRIGSHVHISTHACLIGAGEISVGDYVALSGRVIVYSSSDDYSGEYMVNPMVPAEFTNVDHRPVSIARHSIVGAGSVLLPGVTLGEGVAVGALSLVNADCEAFGVYAGVPARYLKPRSRNLLELERRFAGQAG